MLTRQGDVPSPSSIGIAGPSLANYKDKFVILSGGVPDGSNLVPSQQVHMYNCERNMWKDCPEMNTPRQKHSSIVLGKMLYVFFGIGRSSLNTHNKSIERLDVHAHLKRAGVPW